MNGHIKAVIAILVIGIIAILAFRYTRPIIEENQDLQTSDAGQTRERIRIGVDNWVGYFPLCSPEMKRRLRERSIQLKCVDDQADYRQRFQRLDAGKLDFAVATVDAYLLNGVASGFPGVIIAVIDESRGGDAIVAREARIANLDDLKSGRDFRLALTPDSPSEHLLKAIGSHFDIARFRDRKGSWRIDAEGSGDALRRLLAGEVDVAVLWEPDVSRALSQPGIGKIISTADTDKLIVDVLLVSRDYLGKHPETVNTLVQTFFETLKSYHLDPDRLATDIRTSTGLGRSQVNAMLNGVSWVGLRENAIEWYGLTGAGLYGDEALIDTIESTLDILIDNGDFSGNPIPGEDPYRLTNRHIIRQLYENLTVGTGTHDGATGTTNSLTAKFPPLDDEQWQKLKEIGTLRVDPIRFNRGSGLMNLAGKKALDRAVERLKRYPNFRILIKGHTGVRGDPKANLALSAERAAAVQRYLSVTYGIDDNRIRSIGYGASRPLPRLPGESSRAYSYRLPRVEISLLTEAY